MKKFLALLLAALMLVTVFAACAKEEPAPAPAPAPVESDTDVVEEPTEGKVFNIYIWNDEFQKFFKKYYEGTMPINEAKVAEGEAPVYYTAAPGVPEGITVNWVLNPNADGVYQQKLDEALAKQATAAADDKIDMFLAEADYIQKYVDEACTMDIAEIGYKNANTMYQYTIDAATSVDGVCKGVSFQCCPAALIYRRSIAKAVLGTDVPEEVQAQVDDWAKFEAVAQKAGDLGYMITPNYAATYRVFSNNCTIPWVDANKKLQFDAGITTWIEQTKKFMDNGWTANYGLWDGAEQGKEGKAMCWFGPAWYFNFSMTGAQAETSGDWAITKGPQAHFWGGTWLLAATGTDNPTMLKEVFETFTTNADVCSALVENEAQYPNNTAVVDKFANDATYGSAFLGGQNDIALFSTMAGDIKWENHTIYDQLLNEKLQEQMLPYFTGEMTYEDALNNYYDVIEGLYPDIVIE